jgi:hypothetical protein
LYLADAGAPQAPAVGAARAGTGDLDAVMTYDKRLADGARHHGLAVLAPS